MAEKAVSSATIQYKHVEIYTEKKNQISRQNARGKDKRCWARVARKDGRACLNIFINFTKNWTLLLEPWLKYC